MTRLQYEVIRDWNERRTAANFFRVYKHCFDYRYLLWRPLWRIWRIFRNTVLTDKYEKLEQWYADRYL